MDYEPTVVRRIQRVIQVVKDSLGRVILLILDECNALWGEPELNVMHVPLARVKQ